MVHLTAPALTATPLTTPPLAGLTFDLQPFQFEDFTVRLLVAHDGKAWFPAMDVTRALGYANGRDAVARHCRMGGVAKHDTPTTSGVQPLTFIDEPNLYRLAMRSNAAHAERFQDWVCEVVLPAIRRSGSYAVAAPALPDFPTALRMLADSVEKEQRLTQELQQQTLQLATTQAEVVTVKKQMVQVVEEAGHAIKFAEAVAASDELYLLDEAAKVLKVKPRTFRSMLRDAGMLYRDEKKETVIQYYLDNAWFVEKLSSYRDPKTGLAKTSKTPQLTGKGLAGIARKFKLTVPKAK